MLVSNASGKMNPLISVIIPCFNQGIYLADAIESVALQNNKNFEIIVIDDGSTDNTATVAKTFPDITYIYQENQGLAAARNNGIQQAKGKYILPLDSDNKIIPSVFMEAARLMEADERLDVVYTDAFYFGNRSGDWIVGRFRGNRLLYANYIDACALIRKTTLLETGLYDGNLPGMGSEDWELWVNFYLHQRRFFYLPKAGFYYRIVTGSMLATVTEPNYIKNKQYIFQKYASLISEKIFALDKENRMLTRKFARINNMSLFKRLHAGIKLIAGKKIVD